MIIKSHIRGGYRSTAEYMKEQGKNEKTRLVELSDPEAKNLDQAFQKMWEVASCTACIDQHGSPSHDTDSVPMRGHGTHAAAKSAANPATQAFMAANDKMHQDMAIAYTGNADTDFVRGMIPHHQGAIDMAKVVLDHGKDPELRQLAQDIIAAQTKEIAMMQDWLKEHGKPVPQAKE